MLKSNRPFFSPELIGEERERNQSEKLKPHYQIKSNQNEMERKYSSFFLSLEFSLDFLCQMRKMFRISRVHKQEG